MNSPAAIIVVRHFGPHVDDLAARLRGAGLSCDVWVGSVSDLLRKRPAVDVFVVDSSLAGEDDELWAELRRESGVPLVYFAAPGETATAPYIAAGAAGAELRNLIDAALLSFRAGRQAGPSPAGELAPGGVPRDDAPRQASLTYRDIIDQAADAIFVADATGRYTAANSRALEMLGYTEQEFLGKRLFDLHPPEDLKQTPINFARLEGGKPILAERRLVRKDGSVFDAEISARLLPDGSLMSVVRDITERKRSALQLAESEERYRQIFNMNQAIKFVLDPDSGAIVDANQAAVDFYGYPYETLKGKRIFEFNTLPEAEVRAKMKAAIAANQLYFQFDHRVASGAVRHVEVYTGPLTIGGKLYLHSIVHDVTDRREAAERLRRSEQYYRSLIENISDLITIVGADAVIRFESPAVRRVLGFEPEELVGRPAPEYMHPDDVDTITRKFEALVNRPGSSETAEVRLRHKDGTWRHFESTVTNLLDDAVVSGVIINSRDITARVKAEAELRRRTDELERLNQFMVDRELRMIELKREVALLKKSLDERGPDFKT